MKAAIQTYAQSPDDANAANNKMEQEWSDYNHHWAGIIVLLAGLLATAHSKRVCLVGDSGSAFRLPRSADLSVMPVTRPETWALLKETTPEVVRLVGRLRGRSGMQRIDPSLFDAARADGARGWQAFWHITLPQLMPEIRVVLLLTVIASIKSFDLIFTMTRGGPGNATLVPNIYMYQLGFQLNRFGYAAAVAIIGAILVFVVNFIIHQGMRRLDRSSN